jgi:hypothetical protein
MEPSRLYVNGKVLCTGVQQATSRSEEPVLCLIKGDAISFVAVSGLRMVISWKAVLPKPAPGSVVFVIPPLIAELLACDAICSQVGVEFVTRGGEAVARLTDHLGSYELRWASDVSTFPAPEAFRQLMQVPEALVEVSHLRFSDAVHQAVANLGRMEAEQQVSPSKLAILIDLDFGRLRVEGEEIVTTASHQFYFDPRLVIRALEFLKEKTLRVGITPVSLGSRGYLSLVSEQDGWLVHCALLSIGLDTQQLYPLPPGRNR